MNKKIVFSILILCLSFAAMAQDENDALRYGFTQYYGTARGMAVGGATGSLGADFSGLSINPAGLGLYRSSEFSFTPNISFDKTSSSYINNEFNESDSKFNFNEFGLILANAKKGQQYQRSKWKTFNVAFGMNRLSNFNNDYRYKGDDNQSSIIETFAQQFNQLGGLNSNTLQLVSEGPYAAYQTYLIDYGLNDSTQAQAFVPFTDGLNRSKSVYQKGSAVEYVFSMGANYDEKLMLGATVGIPRIEYASTTVLSEDDISGNNDNDFKYFDFTEKLSTSGGGINLKLGAIYKVSNGFRFGVAIHTPTVYQLRDVSSIEMESNTENYLINNNIATSSVSRYVQEKSQLFEYAYYSPLKAIGSATVLFKDKGFVSADVEYIDYHGMSYNYGSGYRTEADIVNQTIKNTYKSAVNLRLGGEVKLKELALRAGIGYYGSPYSDNYEGEMTTMSLGIGYRNKAFFADLGGQIASRIEPDATHTLARAVDIPLAAITTNATNMAFTIGWKF